MKKICFHSGLHADFRKALEALLYFSPDQTRSGRWVAKCVSRFGAPVISRHNGLIRARLADHPDAQSLFAVEHAPLRDRLVGAVIFHREHHDRLTVAYLAVAHEYTMAESEEDMPLAVQLCVRVAEIARQINGVTMVEMVGSQGPFIRIPLAGSTP